MKKSSRRVWAMILTGALAAAGSMTAWAADRTISNVTLRIDSELESGSLAAKVLSEHLNLFIDLSENAKTCLLYTSPSPRD